MKNFCIVTNKKRDPESVLSEKIREYLLLKGANCHLTSMEDGGGRYRYTNPKSVPLDTECVITVGGDGTLLQASRDLMERDVVFFGFNRGNLGFLAEADLSGVEEAIDRLLTDDIKIENRMMLKGRVLRENESPYENFALNDIVIHSNGGIRIADYNIYVNGTFFNHYRADGVILATPTGSTAYNLSAGGPVVEPNASLIVLTPICAHSIHGRSIIFSAKDTVIVEAAPAADGRRETSLAAFDGCRPVEIEPGDTVEISRSEIRIKFAKLDDTSFLQVIKEKMGDK